MTHTPHASDRCDDSHHRVTVWHSVVALPTSQFLAITLPHHAVPAGLSRREHEVWHLLARRWTNDEISRQLDISRRTVEHHVGRIIAKLGVANRREAGMLWLASATALQAGELPSTEAR